MKNPLVSVIMTCYNHEKYIAEALESIINQSFNDFEFIIIDDGSDDKSTEIIKSYSDSRIKLIEKNNTGPSDSFNYGIKISHGEYLALMSGDDVAFEHRLETQLNQISAHNLDIIFSLPIIIGPKSNRLDENLCPHFFNQQFNSNEDLIYKFFYNYNFLCAPSAFLRHSMFYEIGLFNVGLLQLQDFEFWIRACKKNANIKVFDEPLIKYRYLFGDNLSDHKNHNRSIVELFSIYNSFFDNFPQDLFDKAFQNDKTLLPFLKYRNHEFKQAILLFNHPETIVRYIGADRIIKFLEHEHNTCELLTETEFLLNQFFKDENYISYINEDKKKQDSLIKRIKKFVKIYSNLSLSTDSTKQRVEEYLDNDEHQKAINLLRSGLLFNIKENTFKTFADYTSKIYKVTKQIALKVYWKLKTKIDFTNNSLLQVYLIRNLYDYSKKKDTIIFEGVQEECLIKKPVVIGLANSHLEGGIEKSPTPYIVHHEQATILGGSDFVLTSDGLLLSDELSEYPGNEFGIKSEAINFRHKDKAILGFYGKKPTIIESGIYITCGHDTNYFHWLLECLPKVVMFDELHQFTNDPLLIQDGLHNNLESALKKCNLSNRQIIRLEKGKSYFVNNLFFPSPLSRIVDRYGGKKPLTSDIVLSPKWIKKTINLLKENHKYSDKPWRKLFLTRYDGLRSLINREEIETLLLDNGYQIVDLQNYSLIQQIDLFSQSVKIIAPTGAALTNMIFCQPGAEILILMSNHNLSNYYFWSQLGNIANVDVKIMACKRQYHLNNRWSVHDDYFADVELISHLI